jgi:hypothetical protein
MTQTEFDFDTIEKTNVQKLMDDIASLLKEAGNGYIFYETPVKTISITFTVNENGVVLSLPLQ